MIRRGEVSCGKKKKKVMKGFIEDLTMTIEYIAFIKKKFDFFFLISQIHRVTGLPLSRILKNFYHDFSSF